MVFSLFSHKGLSYWNPSANLTSVDDSLFMQVGHSTADSVHQMCGVMLVVVALLADSVKKLTALSQLGDQVH